MKIKEDMSIRHIGQGGLGQYKPRTRCLKPQEASLLENVFSTSGDMALPQSFNLPLPKIDDLPFFIQPEPRINVKEIRKITNILLHICPDLELEWEADSEVGVICNEIMEQLQNALIEYAGNAHYSCHMDVSIDDHTHEIEITCQGAYEIWPIGYTGAIALMGKACKRMLPMVIESIRILGTTKYNWEDIRMENMDRYEDMASYGCDEGEEETYKEMVNELKRSGQKKQFFDITKEDLDDRILSLQKAVDGFGALDNVEEAILSWINGVIAMTKNDMEIKCIKNAEYGNEYLPIHLSYPILYSFNDKICECLDEDLNCHSESSGEPLILTMTSKNMDAFLQDIKYLGACEKTFSFFNKLGDLIKERENVQHEESVCPVRERESQVFSNAQCSA